VPFPKRTTTCSKLIAPPLTRNGMARKDPSDLPTLMLSWSTEPSHGSRPDMSSFRTDVQKARTSTKPNCPSTAVSFTSSFFPFSMVGTEMRPRRVGRQKRGRIGAARLVRSLNDLRNSISASAHGSKVNSRMGSALVSKLGHRLNWMADS